MSLFESVIKCSDEELDNIVNSSLQEKNNSNKIEKLGFVNSNKVITLFNGKYNDKIVGYLPE